MKKCLQCGNEFKPTRYTQKFCTVSCRTKYHIEQASKETAMRPVTMANCPNCGKPFVKTGNSQKYCSKECRLDYEEREKADMREHQMCLYCGEYFSAPSIRKYCSKRCAQRACKGVTRIRRKKDGLSLVEIAKRCRDENLSYGQYVAKYGL